MKTSDVPPPKFAACRMCGCEHSVEQPCVFSAALFNTVCEPGTAVLFWLHFNGERAEEPEAGRTVALAVGHCVHIEDLDGYRRRVYLDSVMPCERSQAPREQHSGPSLVDRYREIYESRRR